MRARHASRSLGWWFDLNIINNPRRGGSGGSGICNGLSARRRTSIAARDSRKQWQGRGREREEATIPGPSKPTQHLPVRLMRLARWQPRWDCHHLQIRHSIRHQGVRAKSPADHGGCAVARACACERTRAQGQRQGRTGLSLPPP